MISCDLFRRDFTAATEDASLLEHLRSCDGCLPHAVSIDPDVLFRAIGGTEMMPPGGIDAFVGDVMREVHLRSTESAIVPPRKLDWMRRLAVAATLIVGMSAGTIYYETNHAVAPAGPVITAPRVARAPISSRPVIESYDAQNATIVEVPADSQADVKVVMIFDESLPADL